MTIEINKSNNNILHNNLFNPYNSLSSGLINSCLTLPKKYNLLFNSLLKANNFNKNKYINKFKNKTNYIYLGALIENENILYQESMKIISIYKKIVDKNEHFNIFFKGHPREKLNIRSMLINKIKK